MKLERSSTRWLIPIAVLAVSTGVAGTVIAAKGTCSGDSCISVNGVLIRHVRYNGEVLDLAALPTLGASVTVVAPLSAETGYIWAFDSQDEADTFNAHLVVLEENCWVPGTCSKQHPPQRP